MPDPSPPTQPTAVAPIFAESIKGRVYAPTQAAGGNLTNASGGSGGNGGHGGSGEGNAKADSKAAVTLFLSTGPAVSDARSSHAQEGGSNSAQFGRHHVSAWLKTHEKDFNELLYFVYQREEQFEAKLQLIENQNQQLLDNNKRLKVDQYHIKAYNEELERVTAIATQIGNSAVDDFSAGLRSIERAYRKQSADQAGAARIMHSLLSGKVESLEGEVQKLQKEKSELEKQFQESKIEVEQLQRKLESQESGCSPEFEPEWVIPSPDKEEEELDKELRSMNEELEYYMHQRVVLESELVEEGKKLAALEQKLAQNPEMKAWELKDVQCRVENTKKELGRLENDIKVSIRNHDEKKEDKESKELRRDYLRNERMKNKTRSSSYSSADSGSRSRGTPSSSLSRKTSSTNATDLTTIIESSETPSADEPKSG